MPLKINATIKKPAHECIVKAVPTGIMEMTDFGPRASHGGEGGALALEALHPD